MICIAKTDLKPDCLFAYTGRPFDKDVGLQSNEIRHYEPTVGRWLSEDHIGYRPDGNLYRYPVFRGHEPIMGVYVIYHRSLAFRCRGPCFSECQC